MQVDYNMILWVKFFNLTIQMEATEKYIPSVLFVMTYEVVLSFESVDEILNCDHSNDATEQYIPSVLFVMTYEVVLSFESVDEILNCGHSNDATEQYIPEVLFVMTHEVVPAFASVDEILDPVVQIPIKLILASHAVVFRGLVLLPPCGEQVIRVP